MGEIGTVRPKVPKGQTLWVSNYDVKGDLISYITSDEARTKYTLYKMVDGTPEKVAAAKTPIFEEEKPTKSRSKK